MEKFDVIIIGAGPAGLSAAKILGENKKKVLLIEKNSEVGDKICAGGLTFKDFEFNIPESLAEKSFYSMKVHCFNEIWEIKKERLFVVTIDRKDLGQWMLEEVQKQESVEIRLNSEVTEVKDNSIILKDGQEIEFDYLIGSDGSMSVVRKYLKLPTQDVFVAMQYVIPKVFPDLEVFFDQDLFGLGYAWIFPHKNSTSVGCGSDTRSQKSKNIFNNFQEWLKSNNIDVGDSKLQTFPINFDYRGFIFGNKFLVGDAGGFGSGLTGEGIYFAIVSGQEAAKKILNPKHSLSKIRYILRMKKIQEKLGRLLKYNVLRNKYLTQYFFKKYF